MFRPLHSLIGTCLFIALFSGTPAVFAQNLTAGAERPDQTFWQTIKDTTLPDLFTMFIERYPNSAHRAQAEQRLKRLQSTQQPSALERARLLTGKTAATARVRGVTPMAKAATRSPVLGAPVLATAPTLAPALAPPARIAPVPAPILTPAPAPEKFAAKKPAQALINLGPNGQYFSKENSPETILLIQYNLNRVGCRIDTLDGKWGPNSQKSAERFALTIDQPLVTIAPNTDLLRVLKNYAEGTCPPIARPAPLIRRPSYRRIQKAKKRPFVRVKQRARKKHRARKKVRARKAARKSTRRARPKRARRANTTRRNSGRSSRRRQTVSAGNGRSNGGGGQRRSNRGASGSNLGGGQLYKPGRGGSNRGGGQKRRNPGRGASNGGGGQRYSLPPSRGKGSKVTFPSRGKVRLPKFKLRIKPSFTPGRLKRR